MRCAVVYAVSDEASRVFGSTVKSVLSGESIPIRLFLNGYDLTPTMRDINKKFSVRYYLNLVLVDEEDRRYFKQQVNTCGGRFVLVDGKGCHDQGRNHWGVGGASDPQNLDGPPQLF